MVRVMSLGSSSLGFESSKGFAEIFFCLMVYQDFTLLFFQSIIWELCIPWIAHHSEHRQSGWHYLWLNTDSSTVAHHHPNTLNICLGKIVNVVPLP